MNALLPETWVGVNTFASTLWAATTVNVQQDLLSLRMREHVKVGIELKLYTFVTIMYIISVVLYANLYAWHVCVYMYMHVFLWLGVKHCFVVLSTCTYMYKYIPVHLHYVVDVTLRYQVTDCYPGGLMISY